MRLSVLTTRADRKTFRNEDLVLKVTPNIDPAVWNETKYEAFLDELGGTREYQKQAIGMTLRYLLGGNVAAKWGGHEINTSRFIKPLRTMHAIGG